MTEEASRPYGRDAVRAALIAAATRLFAADGPARVSLRAIADEADVNLGQIPRHFGSKDALLGAVLEEAAKGIATTPGPSGDLSDVAALFDAAANSPYWRLLAHVLLDGIDPMALQHETPTFNRLIALLREGQGSGAIDPVFEPRLGAAAMGAISLGWLLFQPFLVSATGLQDETSQDVNERMRGLFLDIISRLGPPKEGP